MATKAQIMEQVGFGPYTLLDVIEMPAPGLAEVNPSAYSGAVRNAQQNAKMLGVSLCSCNICGTGIRYNYVIRNSEGRNFVVGSECVQHLHDPLLNASVQNAALRIERRKRQDRELAKRQAEMDAQLAAREAERVANEAAGHGRCTNWERDQQQKQAAEAAAAAIRRERWGWLLPVLEGHSGDFCASIVETLLSTDQPRLSPRAQNILCDVYGKAHGRSGSRACEAACDQFYVRFAESMGITVDAAQVEVA